MSSVLITLGFLAQVVSRLDPFVTALPALFVPWELTLAALVRNTIDNLVLLGQMQRIRGYNRALVPEANQFFDPPRPTRSSSGAGHRGAAKLADAAVVHRRSAAPGRPAQDAVDRGDQAGPGADAERAGPALIRWHGAVLTAWGRLTSRRTERLRLRRRLW